MRPRPVFAGLAAVLVFAGLSGCSGSDGGPAFSSSTTGASLSIDVSSNRVPANGTSRAGIAVYVTGGDTQVEFSTTLGTLSATTATARNGLATVSLYSTAPGEAMVTANAGKAQGVVWIYFYEE